MKKNLNSLGDDRARHAQAAPPASQRTLRSPHAEDADVKRPIRRLAGAAGRWWSLMLDGRRAWGLLDISPTRHGVTHYRLIVFPPGINPVERRLLRAWRAWPTWGLALWLLALILLHSVIAPVAALGLTAAYLSVGAMLFCRVAGIRGRVRGLRVVRVAGRNDPRATARYAELSSLTAALDDADDRLRQGDLSTAGHEAIWWRAYERLGNECPGTEPEHGQR